MDTNTIRLPNPGEWIVYKPIGGGRINVICFGVKTEIDQNNRIQTRIKIRENGPWVDQDRIELREDEL
jgi:hypothetical protein